jgi:serine-type D-Ala-D-Ala carboxypeptidase/endopeptidase
MDWLAALAPPGAGRLLALPALFAALAGCGGQVPHATGAQPSETVTNTFDREAGKIRGGASLLVLAGGRVATDRSTGAIGSQTEVALASATKWLSGIVIMSLVDDGTLTLDTPVGRYFPDAPADKRPITLRQLMTHTSGLPGAAARLNSRRTTLAECAADILRQPLNAPPGRIFLYGGASFQVAGRMAEVATGTSWETLFEERVTRPLRLTGTRFDRSNPRIAGGATSTRDEFGVVLRMILGGGSLDGMRVLSEEAVRTMELDHTGGAALGYSPHPSGLTSYGIGVWRDRQTKDGTVLQLSSQGAFGFSPWIDREAGLVGVFSVVDRLGGVYALVAEFQRLARAGAF